MILAWAFDITPSGIKRTDDVAPETASPSVPEKSIAVLPFENLSDDRENTFFADGVHDDILSSLARIADLKVISRTSVQQYRTARATCARSAKRSASRMSSKARCGGRATGCGSTRS